MQLAGSLQNVFSDRYKLVFLSLVCWCIYKLVQQQLPLFGSWLLWENNELLTQLLKKKWVNY
jgi:hypothetical protein